MRGKEGSTIVTIATTVFLVLPLLSPICHSASEGEETTGTPAGWSEDVRLSYIINTNLSHYPRNYSFDSNIDVNGDYIHSVWLSSEVDNFGFLLTANITYSRSIDNGQTWDDPIFLSNMTTGEWNDAHAAVTPRIGINGSIIHVVWVEFMGGDSIKRIRYRRSLDNGDTWEPTVNITPYDGIVWRAHPDIAVWNDDIHIVWDDNSIGGQGEIFYRNSTNAGADWNPEVRVTFDETRHDNEPKIAVNDTNLHLTWGRLFPGDIAELMYMMSPDNGISWQPEILLSLDDGWISFSTDIAVNDSSIHIGFDEQKHMGEGGKWQAYYINSTDNGATFNPQYGKRLADTDIYNGSGAISISLDGNIIHIIWSDSRDGDPWAGELYYTNSTDGGFSWEPNLRLTYAPNSTGGHIAVENGFVHIVMQDRRTGENHSSEIFYKRYPDFPPDPTYNITLDEGWNLISLPLEQTNESITEVLSSINGKWDYVQAYDPLAPEPWKTYATFKPSQLNELQSLNHRMGFWINVTEPNVTLTVSGPIPASTSINLYAGWNLVGYPSLVNETIANALWGTGADKVEVFDPAEPYRIREVGPSYVMKPGEGYWVHVPADTVWTINW